MKYLIIANFIALSFNYTKMRVLLLLIALLAIGCLGECTDKNYLTDPKPWGGGVCFQDLDCGGKGGGECHFFPVGNTTGTCQCEKSRGDPDCSYYRTNVDGPGGKNIGLAFVLAGGVGNLEIGRRSSGLGQLLLIVLGWVVWISGAVVICCGGAVFGVPLLIIGWLMLISGWAWSIADGAYILQCVYRDTKGYAMFSGWRTILYLLKSHTINHFVKIAEATAYLWVWEALIIICLILRLFLTRLKLP